MKFSILAKTSTFPICPYCMRRTTEQSSLLPSYSKACVFFFSHFFPAFFVSSRAAESQGDHSAIFACTSRLFSTTHLNRQDVYPRSPRDFTAASRPLTGRNSESDDLWGSHRGCQTNCIISWRALSRAHELSASTCPKRWFLLRLRICLSNLPS